jgi:hypothetical protein
MFSNHLRFVLACAAPSEVPAYKFARMRAKPKHAGVTRLSKRGFWATPVAQRSWAVFPGRESSVEITVATAEAFCETGALSLFLEA